MKTGKTKSSGVALIIVLGLVAILTIVCVSFAISMRIERSGAANLRHASMARQLAKGAMARAIADIDANLGDEAFPAWYDKNDPSALTYGSPRKWTGTFPSKNDASPEHVTAHILTPEAEKYLPPGLAFKGYATQYGYPDGATIAGPEWLPVYGNTNGNLRSLMGRYSYFVMDTTGLLDISVAGRAKDDERWMGEDPSEIRLTKELFKDEIVDDTKFVNALNRDGQYASFAEFRALQNDSSVIKDVRSFSTFSAGLVETNKVFIGKYKDETDAAYLKRLREDDKAKIIEAFCNSGLLSGRTFHKNANGKITDCEQARWAYLGLIDFVDDDDEMEDDDKIRPWERPATENMALMSGFIAKLTLECRQKAEYNKKTGKWVIDPDICEMRLMAETKIPFVFPFVIGTGNKPDLTDLTMEGKVKLDMDAAGKKSPVKLFADEVRKSNPVTKSMTGTKKALGYNSLTGCDVATDWIEVDADDGAPPQTDTIPYMMIRVAGSTKRDSQLQHRYPITDDGYAEPEAWMTARLSLDDEGFEFDVDDPADTDPESGAKLWRIEVVTWAEFLDPRFASLDMANDDEAHKDYPDWTEQLPYYRASHLGDETSVKTHYLVPATLIKNASSTKAYFSGFTAAKNNNAMLKDFVGDDEDDPDIFGGYFDGTSARNSGSRVYVGASPLASYILRNPSVANDLFKMNMDGLRKGDSSTYTDTAANQWRAYVKNAPLESVGELGYLPVGAWQTIRLYSYGAATSKYDKTTDKWGMLAQFNRLPCDLGLTGPECKAYGFESDVDYHPVLDNFTLDGIDKPVDHETHGRINLNTLSPSILASAFHRMPVGTETESGLTDAKECYVDNSSHKTVAIDTLAPAILQLHKDEGGFTRLSDMGKFFTAGSGGHLNGSSGMSDFAKVASYAAGGKANTAGTLGEFEREAMIRNSCGLFTTCGQSFIIVARGESYSPIFGKTSIEGGTVNAAKTAIAHVRRDTGVDENGKHRIGILFFKIIDD